MPAIFLAACLRKLCVCVYMCVIVGLIEKAGEAYKTAMETCENKLSTTHPIRLGLALNYSVFYYEIENSTEKACQLAKKVILYFGIKLVII